jgi:hypothetical protein
MKNSILELAEKIKEKKPSDANSIFKKSESHAKS